MLGIHESCLAVVLAGTMLATTAYAEHLLVKANGSEFVGIQISQETFRACGPIDIPIEGGKVSMTGRKCPKTPQLSVTAPVIEEIDVRTRTFKAKEANVGVMTFYFPKVSETSNVSFLELKPGDKLKINAWMLSNDEHGEVRWVTNDVRIDKPHM